MKKAFFPLSVTFSAFLLLQFGQLAHAQEQFDKMNSTEGGDDNEVKMPDDQGNYLDFKSGWFLGGTAGTNLMYGDVTTYNIFPKFKDFNKSFGRGLNMIGGKKIKWGLSGEVEYSTQKTQGYKSSVGNTPFYFDGDYKSYSVSAKYNLSDFYMRNMGKRSNGKVSNRLQTYFSVGVGQVFFRSRLYFAADKRIKNQFGYKETTVTQSTGQQLLEKDKALRALIVPVSFKFQYRLNFQTDLVFDFYYVNAFTDKLDGWERSWTSNDKYLYAGVGLIRFFGRTSDDEVPDSMRYLPKDKKKKSDNTDNIVITDDTKKGLFRKRKKSSTSDEELNLRLKMFETQLKLFEMQNMIDNKK